MTLIIQKPTGAKVVLAKDFSFDPDAAAYIAAVEAADTQALETNTRYAINDFVIGCKQDGIWTAIKASCILVGARTLTGALVPLVGTAPTNFNFVSGDYNRKTGLVGNGSTKYLDSNRAGDADPQNSKHVALYKTDTNRVIIANKSASAGATYLDNEGTGFRCRIHTSAGTNDRSLAVSTGLYGGSRSGSSTGSLFAYGNVFSITTASEAPQTDSIFVLARPNASTGIPELFSGGRIAFYSIGESLDLALLDARVTDLINAIGAAF
jgi:hypothetical protein